MSKVRWVTVLVGAVLLAIGSNPAQAANELFGWVFTSGTPGSSRLVTFNLATGARSTIGSATPDCCFVSGA